MVVLHYDYEKGNIGGQLFVDSSPWHCACPRNIRWNEGYFFKVVRALISPWLHGIHRAYA